MTLYKTWLTTIGSIGCIFSRVLPPFQAGSHRCAELATATRCPRGHQFSAGFFIAPPGWSECGPAGALWRMQDPTSVFGSVNARPTIARSPLSQYHKGAGGFSPSTRKRMTRATYRPSFGSSARNTAEYLFASSCRMALTSLGVKRTVKPTSAVEQPTSRNPRRGYK